PTSAAVYLPGNKVPAPASLFRNTAVGNAYLRILKEAEAGGGGREAELERARKVWSQGFVAEAIDRFYTNEEIMDVSGKRNKGLLRGDDMARWQATVEEPLTYDYGRYTVCKAGPWAQSPVTLQQLALLKGFGLDGADPTSPDFIHTLIEVSKLAFADREAFYGDPKFVDVPMQTLLSDAYNADRRKLIDPAKASFDQRPGKVEGYGGVVQLRKADGSRAAVAASGAGEPTVGRMGQMSGDTARHSEPFPPPFGPRTARPGVLVLEGRIPAETVRELRKRGHEVEMNDDWSEGRLTAASRVDPWRKAAANPRGMQGYAAGR